MLQGHPNSTGERLASGPPPAMIILGVRITREAAVFSTALKENISLPHPLDGNRVGGLQNKVCCPDRPGINCYLKGKGEKNGPDILPRLDS